jgi:hypothetical protein
VHLARRPIVNAGAPAPRRPSVAALQEENQQLRAHIEQLRASTSYRLGHALVRSVKRILPGRTAGSAAGPPLPTPAPSTASSVADPADLTAPSLRPRFAAPGARAKIRTRPVIRPLEVRGPGTVPDGPVFVGGTGRSGTWVIGRMLGAHPLWVNVHTELRFHAAAQGFAAVLTGELSPDDFSRRVLERRFRVTGGGGKAKGLQIVLEYHELKQRLLRFQHRAKTDVADALGQLMLDVLEPYARGRGAVGWSETTPGNAAAADALLTVLPTARLVHTVRDGRDVAASVSKMPWGPATIRGGLYWWAQRLWEAHEACAAADPERVLTIRLEELIHLDRETRYDEVLGFLRFADDTAIRRYFDERVDGRRGNVGRWRGEVEAPEQDRVDGTYRDLLSQLADAGVNALPTPPEEIDALGRHHARLA